MTLTEPCIKCKGVMTFVAESNGLPLDSRVYRISEWLSKLAGYENRVYACDICYYQYLRRHTGIVKYYSDSSRFGKWALRRFCQRYHISPFAPQNAYHQQKWMEHLKVIERLRNIMLIRSFKKWLVIT